MFVWKVQYHYIDMMIDGMMGNKVLDRWKITGTGCHLLCISFVLFQEQKCPVTSSFSIFVVMFATPSLNKTLKIWPWATTRLTEFDNHLSHSNTRADAKNASGDKFRYISKIGIKSRARGRTSASGITSNVSVHEREKLKWSRRCQQPFPRWIINCQSQE